LRVALVGGKESAADNSEVHHFAFEVKDMAELVHQAEYMARHDRVLLYGPGRHGPGNNLFVYFHAS